MPPRTAPTVASRRWRAIGTTVSVLTEDPRDLDLAEELLRYEVDALDVVCSRFREDSELEAVHRAAGTTVAVS
jgi:hypothetical protein